MYLDASALVKLVVAEPQSAALVARVGDWPNRASSELARVEVVRVARRYSDEAAAVARRLLADVVLIPVDRQILDVAESLGPEVLRAIDAVHVASALSLGRRLGALITYDGRMTAAAHSAGLTVLAPP